MDRTDLPTRKLTRLKGYDYSTPGMYFVTVCTADRDPILGEISDGQMQLSDIGTIAQREIAAIASRYANIRIDKYVIMPNHIHMIVAISQAGRMNPSPTTSDIPNVIGKWKAGVTRSVGNAFMHSVRAPIWQRSFHDHIIRGEDDYRKIWEYIDQNVLKWELDCFYTE